MKYNKQNEKNKKRRMTSIILLVILILIVLFLAIKSCSSGNELIPTKEPIYLEDEGTSEDGIATVRTRDEILNELKRQQIIVTDKLSSNITFPSNKAGAIGEWIIENPIENEIIVQAEVYLDNVLIAKSTPIYPNQHITGIALSEDVKSGEYEVTAYLNYYDIESKKFVSKAGYRIHMTVR